MNDDKNPSVFLADDAEFSQFKERWESMEGITVDKNGKHSDRVLAFASGTGPLDNNSIVGVRQSLDSDDNFTKMSKARTYSDEVSLVHRLAHWRASLWSRGFRIVHKHKTVEQVYRNLGERFNLSLSISELMRDVSVTNNGALIWAANEDSADLAYLRTYRPESTRIQILSRTLWLKPTAGLEKEIATATEEQLKEYIRKTEPNAKKHAEKLVDSIRNPVSGNGTYPGFMPLDADDGEYWQLILGSGGTSNQSYDSCSMQSIFTDIELLKMLVEGDWATAFLLKNMIMVVKMGESIDSGPLAGSKRNWAKATDVANLKAQIEKTGKAQILYGNHTIEIEFSHPKPEVFSPEKYDAVIDRICTFFGIGRYLVLGTSGGGSGGGSYAAAGWNVQAIRIDAREKREIVEKHLKTVFSHPTVVSAAFHQNKDIYWHDCFASLESNMLTFIDTDFSNLNRDNLGVLQYSRNGWKTVRTVKIKDVLVDKSALVLDTRLLSDATPDQFRLFLTGPQIINLLGPPDVIFDERGLKEDRQVLAEVTFGKGDGIISQLTAAKELGWDFDTEIAQKARELEIPELLVPIFEKNQGMALAILQNALDIGMDMVDAKNGKSGKPGRPNERPETTQDTNAHPRPSTASLGPQDFAAMTDEELADMNIAIKHFQDTHHVKNGKWVKNKK